MLEIEVEFKRVIKLAGRASMTGPGHSAMSAKVDALAFGANVLTDAAFNLAAANRDPAARPG